MISWLISTAGVLTGFTTASSTASVSADQGGEDSSYTVYNIQQASSFFSAYTSQDTGGTTAASSSTYVATIDTSYSFSIGTYTESGSYSETFNDTSTGFTSGLLETIQSQTSTTESYSLFFSTTSTTTTETSVWTASQEESSKPISFYQTTTTSTALRSAQQSQQATRVTTTTIAGTMIATATALVVEAKTDDANAEVIYYISSSALSWNTFSAASAVALTATKVTLCEMFKLEEAKKATSGNHSSFSWSNESSSYSTLLTTTTTVASSQTIVTNSLILPNETTTSAHTKTVTTATTNSANLWSSASGTCDSPSNTTTTYKEVSTRSTSPGTSWLGSISWHAPRTTTVSRQVTASTFAAEQITFSDNVGLGVTGYPYAYDAASAVVADQNIALVNGPQVLTQIAGNVSQMKFVPVFAQINDSKGQWFSIGNTTLSNVSYANVSRANGITIFPQSADGESYGRSAAAYTVENGSSTSTSSVPLQVQGQTSTTAIGSVIGIAGGLPKESETFAYGASTAGVFKNRIDGSTTSFAPGATTFNQSQGISLFEPITALAPNIGSGATAVFPVFWAVPRNSTALPPAMPPNA